jgi:hypothetical protein
VAFHPADIGARQVYSAPGSLHDITCRHNAARDRYQPAADDVGDEQLIGREIVLAFRVVPHVRVTVFRVRLLLGAGPFPDALFRGGTIPLTGTVGQREILECGDSHVSSFRSSAPLAQQAGTVAEPLQPVMPLIPLPRHGCPLRFASSSATCSGVELDGRTRIAMSA